MDDLEFWNRIRSVSELSGSFKLRSGLMSNTYFDKYQFESDPDLLEEMAGRMSRLIPKETEILGGLELGGVPLAIAIAMRTRHPAAFVRKRAKSYGTCRLAEGPSVSGKVVCLVEDVVTTGGQIAESARELRALGAIVHHVVCAILRGEKAAQTLAQESIHLHSVLTPTLAS